MNFILFSLYIVICSDFSYKLIKEMGKQDLISPFFKRIFLFSGSFYLFCGLFLQKYLLAGMFYLTTFPLLLFCFFCFLKKQEEKNLLEILSSLLTSVQAQMKLGLNFMDAWQKSLLNRKEKNHQAELFKISESLRFQRYLHHSNNHIRRFLWHLLEIRRSPQALQRLKNLQKKVQVEMMFLRKSRQVLLQLKLQSLVMALFYGGLIFLNVFQYGFQYFSLICFSLFLFCTGFFWIFKSGQSIKWSL